MENKTEIINVRVKKEVRELLQKVSEPYGGVSKVLHRLIAFFTSNPEQIRELDPALILQEEYRELSRSPEWAISKLKQQGIKTKGDLYWLAEQIQVAWHLPNRTATAIWVAKLAQAIKLLLPLPMYKEEKAGVMHYIDTTFPARGDDIPIKIDALLQELQKESRIYSGYADAVARCFLVLLRDAVIEIPDEVVNEISNLLCPWVFWVAKRALHWQETPREIDITPLLSEMNKSKTSLWLERPTVRVQIFLSYGGGGPFLIGSHPFSCGFSFGDKITTKAIFACTSQTFYELIQAVAILDSNKEVAAYGHWEIMKNDREGFYSVQKNGVCVFVTKDELNDLISLVTEMYEREDVQRDLTLEFVEVYGAL